VVWLGLELAETRREVSMVTPLLMALGAWFLAATVLGVILGRLIADHEAGDVGALTTGERARPGRAA
jgi:hypothetical protein